MAIHSALLTVSDRLFFALKLFGLAYVSYLAFILWTSAPISVKDRGKGKGTGASWAVSAQIFLVTITNPKGVLFIFALLPVYIPDAGVSFGHGLAMTVVFIALSASNTTFWGLLSGSALNQFTTWPHVGKLSATILLTAVALVWAFPYFFPHEPV